MNRAVLIDKLIEYSIEYYFNFRPLEFEQLIRIGFKGLDNYTDNELKKELAYFEELFRKK